MHDSDLQSPAPTGAANDERIVAKRTIRSFVRRSGRMTRAQRRAIDDHWGTYGLPADEPMLLDEIFPRCAPRVLEIGFGMGESLANLALYHPDWDFLGIEVYQPGIGSLCAQLSANGSSNVRILSSDAAEVMARLLPRESIATVLVFFPDPWPKKRHYKRRLIQPDFVNRVHATLCPGGTFALATDWEHYARQMMLVIEDHGGFSNSAGEGCFSQRPSERPLTRFERRGVRFGHQIWDLNFVRQMGTDKE